MKIMLFIASSGFGGAESAVVNLANSLVAQNEVFVIAFKQSLWIKNIDKKVTIVTLKSGEKRLDPRIYFGLYMAVKHIKPDIFHSHGAKATEIFYRFNRWRNIPWVSTKHNPRKGRIFNKMDQVIAVSSDVADSIIHNRVTVIHNGIMPEVLAPVTTKNKIFTIVAVGRLEKVKAFDQLISECAKLSFDFRLQIVGDGPEKKNLESLAVSSGIDKAVDFLGFRSDIPQLMQKSDVIVVTSHSEGFSLVILEGLFYGNVLISRNVGIAGSILPEKFLINDYQIASKLDDVYRDPVSFKREFTDIKNIHGHKFLLESSSQEHLNLYQKLLTPE